MSSLAFGWGFFTMEYLQQILQATPRDFASSINAEVQILCLRYGGQQEAILDWREDYDSPNVYCNWRHNQHFSPSVRFEWDLTVRTFCDEPKTYNLINPEEYEQLIYDITDSLIPDWG